MDLKFGTSDELRTIILFKSRFDIKVFINYLSVKISLRKVNILFFVFQCFLVGFPTLRGIPIKVNKIEKTPPFKLSD
jgi:hypothetical protein